MNKETGIDAMKYRKMTHIAGVDVEIMTEKGNKYILTIKECYYAKGMNVSGTKTDGYFIEWVEDQLPMVVNSGNRKTIANICKQERGLSLKDARNIGNWAGLKIELKFDPNVKFGGKAVGGIAVVMPEFKPQQQVSDVNAIKLLSECQTQDQANEVWKTLSLEEKALPTVQAKVQELKTKFAAQ